MMELDDRVNHPKHYEKGRVECIELLEALTRGYTGIIAMEIGQLKYLYRVGSKNENGMSIKEKSIQDVNKVKWYFEDMKKHIADIDGPICSKLEDNKFEKMFIIQEFTFDKPDFMKEYISSVINLAYNIKNEMDINTIVTMLSQLTMVMEEKLQ